MNSAIMKRVDSLDEELAESMQGRCDFEDGDEQCIASAETMFVSTSTTKIAGKYVSVELLACTEHAEFMRDVLSDGSSNLTLDSEHAYEHQCAPVYASDRGEWTRYTCDCGAVVGVE